jgi:hypothetical protein
VFLARQPGVAGQALEGVPPLPEPLGHVAECVEGGPGPRRTFSF